MTTALDVRIARLRNEEKAAAKVARRAHEAELKRVAEVQLKREAEKAAQLEKANALRVADVKVLDQAATLTLDYLGISVRCAPDSHADPIAKDRTFRAFRSCHALFANDLERRREAAQREAAGLPFNMPTHERLLAEVADETRLARPLGLTVTTAAEEDEG